MKFAKERPLRKYVEFIDIGLAPDSDLLISWLNANRGSPRYNRFDRILSDIRRIAVLKGDLFSRAGVTKTIDRQRAAVVSKLLQRLNRTLSFYKIFPHFITLADRSWPVCWMPVKAGLMNNWIGSKHRAAAVAYVQECNAAFTLVGLIRNGDLSRLRACKQCGCWFFAKSRRKKFHSVNCRKKWHSSTPEFKESRKQYMRMYRSQEKERDRVALIAARGGKT